MPAPLVDYSSNQQQVLGRPNASGLGLRLHPSPPSTPLLWLQVLSQGRATTAAAAAAAGVDDSSRRLPPVAMAQLFELQAEAAGRRPDVAHLIRRWVADMLQCLCDLDSLQTCTHGCPVAACEPLCCCVLRVLSVCTCFPAS
jgi:hypothetical protein